MVENPSQKEILQPFSLSRIFQCPTQLPASTAPELQAGLYCFYIPKVSTPHELSFFTLNLHIQSLHLHKSRVYWERDEGWCVFGFYIFLCWSVYYSILTLFFLKLSDHFNSFQFSHTISYAPLYSNITNFLLTYHIRVYSLEFCVHLITFSIGGHCFVPHNQLLRCRCNIGTAVHPLFTKSLRSEFH